jgi:hypothetical protein
VSDCDLLVFARMSGWGDNSEQPASKGYRSGKQPRQCLRHPPSCWRGRLSAGTEVKACKQPIVVASRLRGTRSQLAFRQPLGVQYFQRQGTPSQWSHHSVVFWFVPQQAPQFTWDRHRRNHSDRPLFHPPMSTILASIPNAHHSDASFAECSSQ